MFTGIIEEVGAVRELSPLPEGAVITLSARIVLQGLKIGDSIAVNGVCLTVTQTGEDCFTCDMSSETLRVSTFKQARRGAQVNLERSLIYGERMGGHFVLGHVDGLGRLEAKEPSGAGFEMSFAFPQALERYLVYKGSIAIDGISLTISSLTPQVFSVAVIPHTLQSTHLGDLGVGDAVNLEADVLAKHVERFLRLGLSQREKPGLGLTEDYLKSQGF